MSGPTIEQMQEEYTRRLTKPPPPVKNKCKKCGSKKVHSIGEHTERCRVCDNWQVNFERN